MCETSLHFGTGLVTVKSTVVKACLIDYFQQPYEERRGHTGPTRRFNTKQTRVRLLIPQ